MDFNEQDTVASCGQAVLFRHKNTEKLQTTGWKTQARGEEAGAAAFASDQRHLKTKNATRNKEAHFIIIRGSISPKGRTVINVYAPNNRASKY